MRQHVGLVLLLLTTACAGSEANRAVSTDAPPLHSFTLLYTASLLGQLDPCGCSPDMRGGIGRAATIVERVRAEGSPVLLIDGGDRFFSDDTSTNPIAKEQARLQAQTLAAITRLMKYDAVVLGDRDAAHSNDLADLHLPPLLDPSPQSGDGRDATRILDVGAVRVGLFAAGSTDPLRSGESTDSQDAQDAEDTVESVDVRSISERAGALRAQGAHLVIGIIHRPFGPTRDLAPVAAKAGVDLLFASRSDSPLTDESGADPWSVPPVFTLHPRGEELLRIDISLDIDPAAAAATPALLPVPGVEARQAELAAIEERIHILQRGISSLSPGDPMREARADKVVELQERQSEITSAPPPTLPANSRAFTWAFIPVASRIPESSAVRAILDEHDQHIARRSIEIASAQTSPCPEPGKGEAAYVGDATCATCHPAAMEFWKGTRHAGAWHTLVDLNKHFSTQCVSCHVTGFQRPGGACDVVATQGRQNVQCEACHGAGSVHATSASPMHITSSPGQGTCTTCHDPTNSPHFNFPAYLAKILGPGHGAPADVSDRKTDDVTGVAYD